MLQVFIVTAQRRVKTAQKAVVPINVVGGDDVLESGVATALKLTKGLRALAISRSGPQTVAFIRGGNFSVAATSDPSDAFNYGNVYIGRNTATLALCYDLARIEVLKGPQGTLHGRNATAGAINILPVQPNLLNFRAMAAFPTADMMP